MAAAASCPAAGKEDQRGPRRAREVQDRFRRRRRRPVRLRLVLAVGQGRQARNLQDRERRKPAGPWRHADPRLRRLGALLLHRLSQPPSGLSEGVRRQSRELGICRPAVLEGLIFRRHSGAMRSIEPGISRFRVRAYRAPRNDVTGRTDIQGGSAKLPPFSFAPHGRSLQASQACGRTAVPGEFADVGHVR